MKKLDFYDKTKINAQIALFATEIGCCQVSDIGLCKAEDCIKRAASSDTDNGNCTHKNDVLIQESPLSLTSL